MTEGVIVAIVTTTGVISTGLLSLVAIMLNKTREHARSAAKTSASAATDSAITKEQVQNSHTTNLREESDTRHAALILALESIQGKQAEQARSIDDVKVSQRGLQRDIGRLADADLEISRAAREDRARLAKHIEDTTAGHTGTKE